MKFLLEQIDFLHSVLTKMDHPHENEAFSRGHWMFTAIISCAFMPPGLSYQPHSHFQTLMILVIASFLLAYLYGRTRRSALRTARVAIEFPVPPRARFVAFVYISLASIGPILVGRLQPWAAPLVPLIVSLIPWNRIARIRTAL